jgi:hypothetical protein
MLSRAEVSKWKKEYSDENNIFKIVHREDPLSFYSRFGLWGIKPLTDQEKNNRPEIPKDYPVYELWYYRKMGHH